MRLQLKPALRHAEDERVNKGQHPTTCDTRSEDNTNATELTRLLHAVQGIQVAVSRPRMHQNSFGRRMPTKSSRRPLSFICIARSRTRSPWRTRIVVTPALRRMWEESMNEDMVYGLEAEYNILYYEPEVHHSEWFHLRQTTGPNGEELPIVFDDHVGGCLRQKLDVLVEMHALDSFYIGATVDPRTRWIGRPETLERKEMPGHCETWGVQVMLAFTSHGPVLEDSLIKYAQSVYRETCRNKAPDARGQVFGVRNWIYLCF